MNQSSSPTSVVSQTIGVMGYAGDVDASEAWESLKTDPSAFLVDVRTQAEWNFVGIPDLTAIGKKPLFIEWQIYPSMAVNGSFLEKISTEITVKSAPIFCLCRSGARSKSAAIELTRNGYASCFNIGDGFEGPHDARQRRGYAGGWKSSDLPWVQG
ncbi:MAG: rhodanese-like domain-containing protein [Pseudomonadota bacterium]|nr:rhodanese-like domain-containing protein [Pseudomonadota bacterium]